ncbi:MAG: dUTP diphosphatase [Acidobacteriota bacterium]|nr:MAG: dUTP diphosphatase [Acidobacteriota bacterium]
MSSAPTDVTVRVRVLSHGRGLQLPDYATPGAAGLDLRAAVDDELMLAPGARELVPTGLQLEIPRGYEGQVRARSGLAWRHGLGLPNAPGTIDSDYRGELKVLIINWGDRPYTIHRGERIAQLVISPVARAVIAPSDALANSERQGGGFGHSGSF